MLRFHLAGDWEPARVRTAWVTAAHDLPDEVSAVVDRTWDAAIARPGVKLFDGPMCRLESWTLRDDGTLAFALTRTSYKLFFGTNMSHPELADRYGPAVLANPVGVSPALETSDGWLLLGRRNARVAYYPGRVHPFAGSLEPGDADVGAGATVGPDLFAAVRRELAEELAFTDADAELVRLTGIAEDLNLRQPELIFRVGSARTRAQVEAQVDREEHLASYAVRATPDDVAAAAREPLLTPVAVASLLLWGRIAFGDAWFRERRAIAERTPGERNPKSQLPNRKEGDVSSKQK